MKAAQIILPSVNNQGMPIPKVHEHLVRLLGQAFGGTTAFHGSGLWIDAEGKPRGEPVYIYNVAYEPGESNDTALTAIARHIGQEAGQEAMYVQYADQTVKVIDTRRPHIVSDNTQQLTHEQAMDWVPPPTATPVIPWAP